MSVTGKLEKLAAYSSFAKTVNRDYESVASGSASRTCRAPAKQHALNDNTAPR